MVGVETLANGGTAVSPAGGGAGLDAAAVAIVVVTKAAATSAINGVVASNGGGGALGGGGGSGSLAGGGGSGDLMGNGGASSGGEEKVRNPRWMMHETVVLVAAKRKHDEEAGDEYVTAHKKWGAIAVEVKEKGVDRDARQCRKRWSNLYQDYRRIRDWLRTNNVESYWTMRHDKRRDNKLPGSFDQEVYNDMDTFLAKKKGIIPRTGSDSAQRIQDSEGPGSEVEQDQEQGQDGADVADDVVANGNGTPSPSKADMEKDPAIDGASDDRKKRHSKWSKHETVVLLIGKSTYDCKAKDLSASSKAVRSDEKWDSISAYCRENGVDRDAQQCRKRWSNLHNGDYKKVKDWQKKGNVDSYWEMKSEDRRLHKLPGSFDLQVYKVMDDYCTKKGSGDLESVRPAFEKLLAEVDQDHEDQNGVAIVRRDDDQPAGPAPDSVMQAGEDGSNDVAGSKKRKRTTSTEGMVLDIEKQIQQLENGEQNLVDPDRMQMDNLAAMLESSGKAMHQILSKTVQAQIEAQKASSELDRNQRKQQGDNLVSVLNKLAGAMAKIAEKL